jgi:succinate dehydrogenase / fumarate reductase membrane anchor subunit
MDTSTSDLRSKLARAKGLGSAHHGVSHWWLQRVTAVALIPLTFWFVSSLIKLVVEPQMGSVTEWFSSPIHAALLSLMLIATFWHAKLGAQVVIEDYVHTAMPKYTLLLLNNFISFGFTAISILAVLKLHFQISL